MAPNSIYGVSLRQRLPDAEGTSQSIFFDRKTSDATIVHRPSTSPDAAPWVSDIEGQTLPVATKDNDWLGFCSSAVKLQNGDRKGALRKRTDYAASFAASGLTTYYCSYRGCLFQGHSSVDFAWKTVMKDDRLGIKCRWPFLAKSHVRIKAVQGRQYHFQCPICIYTQGHAEGRVWRGIDIFMEHVSTHRGKELNPELVQKLCIINDRTAEDKEDFDINLIPLHAPKRASQSNTSAPTSNSNYNSHLPRDSVSAGAGGLTTPPSTSAASPTSHLSRNPTFSSFSFHEAIWSRKASSAANNSDGLSRTHTNRSDRSDSMFSSWVDLGPLGSSIGGGGAWSEGLSEFKMDREEDYLSPDF